MHFIERQRIACLETPVYPGSAALRRATRGNIVSFPSQIPIFLKQPPPDVQWRVILLYFVRGWSSMNIARRFNVPGHSVWEILNSWSIRALALGHVQIIDPPAFAACCRTAATGPECSEDFWVRAGVSGEKRVSHAVA